MPCLIDLALGRPKGILAKRWKARRSRRVRCFMGCFSFFSYFSGVGLESGEGLLLSGLFTSSPHFSYSIGTLSFPNIFKTPQKFHKSSELGSHIYSPVSFIFNHFASLFSKLSSIGALSFFICGVIF